MTYKGVYRDGIVVLQGDVDLQNGAHVEVNPTRDERRGRGERGLGEARRARAGKVAKAAKRSKSLGKLPGFGMWKDRWPKSMSSADIARELREGVSRRAP